MHFDLFFGAKSVPSSIAHTIFSGFLLFSSLAGYASILIAYLYMLKRLSADQLKASFSRITRKICFKTENKNRFQTQKVKDENKQIFIRIFIIVATDLICGIFVAIMGIIFLFKTLNISPYCVTQNVTNYKHLGQRIVVIIFPLNSVINPYIYCFHLFQSFYRRCKKYFFKYCSAFACFAKISS